MAVYIGIGVFVFVICLCAYIFIDQRDSFSSNDSNGSLTKSSYEIFHVYIEQTSCQYCKLMELNILLKYEQGFRGNSFLKSVLNN